MARGRVFRHNQGNLGDFLKNLAQKTGGRAPPVPPSGSAPAAGGSERRSPGRPRISVIIVFN